MIHFSGAGSRDFVENGKWWSFSEYFLEQFLLRISTSAYKTDVYAAYGIHFQKLYEYCIHLYD